MPPASKGIIAGPASDPMALGGRFVSDSGLGIATTADLLNDCCPNCCCTALSWNVVLAGLTLCTCDQMTTSTQLVPTGLCANPGGGAGQPNGPPYCFYDFSGSPNGSFCMDQVGGAGSCVYSGPGPNITVTLYNDATAAHGACANNPTVVSTTTTIDVTFDIVTGLISSPILVRSPIFVDPTTGQNTQITFFASANSPNRYCGTKCLAYPALTNDLPFCFFLNGGGTGAYGGTATLSPKCCNCGDFNDDFNNDFALGC